MSPYTFDYYVLSLLLLLLSYTVGIIMEAIAVERLIGF